MRMMLISLVVVTLACGASPPAPQDPSRKPQDQWPDESGGVMDSCARACRVLWQYNCPEALPPRSAKNCTELCRSRPQLFMADCVAEVTTKAELSECAVRCQ